MTRVSSTNATAAAQPHVAYALFVFFDFVSGPVRLTSYDQDFTFGGNTYQSLGKLGGVADISETADLIPNSLTFTISGVDPSLMATALTEKYHNRDAQLYVGWLDSNNALVDTPYLIWEGFMDSMPLHSDEEQSSISVVCENRLILWNKNAGWMYTDPHQKQFVSGDSFFNLVASLANKVAAWGSTSVTGSPVPPPPFVPPYGPYAS